MYRNADVFTVIELVLMIIQGHLLALSRFTSWKVQPKPTFSLRLNGRQGYCLKFGLLRPAQNPPHFFSLWGLLVRFEGGNLVASQQRA